MVSESMLARGEKVIFTAKSHWKNLVGPALVVLLAGVAIGFALLVWLPDPEQQTWQRWTVTGIVFLIALAFGIWPFLSWLSSTDTLTTRRLISRRGVISREGREIPIDRVQSVSYRRNLLDRMLGCGTLVVQTAGETSDVELYNVAHLERRILQVQELLLRAEIPAEGNPPPTERAASTGDTERTGDTEDTEAIPDRAPAEAPEARPDEGA